MKNKISSLLNRLNRVKSSLDNKNVSFVCLGLYNHGKSSLLNALIDDYNDETFKVNIIKETSTIKKIVKDNITFIDTPGLNENMQDDETTLGENILESDVYLFVHSCANGELNIQEINYLKKINSIFDDAIDRTIFVLTKTDSISDIGKMENKIKDQLLQNF
ncbi:dynamin family protein [Campylobacter ureolyticus]|uniref:50S ribosome-binding GTPase n=1 Tax=Campylobacter ureolyticus TaxID=827 RepID=A0A9Q4KT48_9BACT|nr:dynamin family protein [Campylobacter ureolyticus]MCZ6104005.1 50S ribosome-binding GTPase [Campylobacter ureolyticus]MCZ6135429.1 50S ribosome-binding GTPase [Campylobacter ureolyticus]MCZ6162319.1 50S ribosome-binding GTPase [Campylobacter ureolyticus]MCZ6171308.1 50S ribosome-binding GTPase [Campylobacter ureolyticus]MDU4982443.1 GTPase [Campylobacter ureolyticus]